MSGLKCEQCVESLGDFVESRMSERDRRATRRHVARCKRCGALLRAYLSIPRMCRMATDFPMPAGLKAILRRVLLAESGSSES